MHRSRRGSCAPAGATLLLAVLILAAPALAAGSPPPDEAASGEDAPQTEKPRGTFSGLMWGDFYAMASHHDPAIEGANGFWFRRIYFTYDHDLGNGWDTRLRLEVNSPGDFETSTSLEPKIKDAYVRWRGGDTSVLVGISGTPTWGVLESHWGYRSVERTPLDLYKMGSSRDFGVAAKGRIGGSGRARYHVMFANGSSNKAEVGSGKAVYGALALDLGDDLVIEAYADYVDRGDGIDRITWQGFFGYTHGDTRIGAQYARQRLRGDAIEGYDLDVASVYVTHRLAEKARLLVRVDRMFDANPAAARISYLPLDPTARSLLLLAGVDFTVGPGVHLIPNIEWIGYDAIGDGPDPDADLMLRATFAWSW